MRKAESFAQGRIVFESRTRALVLRRGFCLGSRDRFVSSLFPEGARRRSLVSSRAYYLSCRGAISADVLPGIDARKTCNVRQRGILRCVGGSSTSAAINKHCLKINPRCDALRESFVRREACGLGNLRHLAPRSHPSRRQTAQTLQSVASKNDTTRRFARSPESRGTFEARRVPRWNRGSPREPRHVNINRSKEGRAL